MLRVKDVNRLKVFGFEKDGTFYKKERPFEQYAIFVEAETRKINACGNMSYILDEMFELFAANLVERVN